MGSKISYPNEVLNLHEELWGLLADISRKLGHLNQEIESLAAYANNLKTANDSVLAMSRKLAEIMLRS